MRVPGQPIAAAILAKLTADLPGSYEVCNANGPANPQAACPYVVLYADPGTPEGSPMDPSRSLTGLFSVRAVGITGDQAARGADRVAAALHDVVVDAGDDRQTYLWQDSSQPVQRDDSAGQPLFEQLLIFGFRSDP